MIINSKFGFNKSDTMCISQRSINPSEPFWLRHYKIYSCLFFEYLKINMKWVAYFCGIECQYLGEISQCYFIVRSTALSVVSPCQVYKPNPCLLMMPSPIPKCPKISFDNSDLNTPYLVMFMITPCFLFRLCCKLSNISMFTVIPLPFILVLTTHRYDEC